MSRRELGSVYTPRDIAQRMVRACLDPFVVWQSISANSDAAPDCRVLDPACGDGAFLLEVFDTLCLCCQLPASVNDASSADCNGARRRLAVVRNHIFGVDIDPAAVEALRGALLKRIGVADGLVDEAVSVVGANIRHGDSLTGPHIAVKTIPKPFYEPSEAHASDRPHPIDWPHDFPAAFAAGGFDLIIGNPPYVRERNAKHLFDALAATDLGRKWREARMDLWYYFVHRSLDLLRPGGILSFIVNSYWMSSRGAGKLIDRLRRETSFEEIVLLENAPVFKDVAGRHMIFRLRKNGEIAESQPAASSGSAAGQPLPDGRGFTESARPAACRVVTASEEYMVAHDELFQPGRLVVARPDSGQAIFENRIALGEFHETRQGMAENPPTVNRRLHRELAGRFPVGMGIFVLQPDELARLNLSAAEQAPLRPYYDTQAVGRYRISDEPTHQVLYLTRATAASLDGLDGIKAHLGQFRPILERRREVQAGKMAWWQLHWPRDEQIFVQPRILSVQMGKRPQFAFAERPTFVGFSINLILAKSEEAFALDVLCGILNSDAALTWFDRHAKHRGINLEINAHVLRQFPLPGRNAEIERTLGQLVRKRQAARDHTPQAAALEKEIEDCVVRLYTINGKA